MSRMSPAIAYLPSMHFMTLTITSLPKYCLTEKAEVDVNHNKIYRSQGKG
jgi:hypothetical protein